MRLKDKNMIVTGGASGIGLATVERCLREGANVVLSDVASSDGAARARQLDGKPGRCLFIACDVTSTEQVDHLVAETAAQLGSVDVVFSNAGIGGISPVQDTPDADYLRIIDINLNGVFRVARAVLRQMYKQGSGSLINCASILGTLGQSGTVAYSAAKGGVVNLTRTPGHRSRAARRARQLGRAGIYRHPAAQGLAAGNAPGPGRSTPDRPARKRRRGRQRRAVPGQRRSQLRHRRLPARGWRLRRRQILKAARGLRLGFLAGPRGFHFSVPILLSVAGEV